MFIMFTAFLCYISNLFVTIHIPLLGSLRNKNLKLETSLVWNIYERPLELAIKYINRT